MSGISMGMISRGKQNRDLLASKRGRIAQLRRMYIMSISTRGPITYKELPESELAVIKHEIRTKLRKRRREQLIVAVALTLLAVTVIVCVAYIIIK